MRWYIKCLLDNLKGIVPAQDGLRNLKRRLCSYCSPPGRTDFAIQEGIELIVSIRSELDVQGTVCLEVGAGWEPVLPILFSLCGARKVIMTDLHQLCSDQTVAAAMDGLRRNAAIIASGLRLDPQYLEQQLSQSGRQGIRECLQRYRIEYLAPCDCTRLPIPGESVDIVYSRAVLEHISPPVLGQIFVESARILIPSGLACHFIDCSDHWEHNDKSISRINFLKYSDELYRWTHLNSMNYQSRLRHSEYVDLLSRSGFAILKEQRKVDAAALHGLQNMSLDARYRHLTPEDVATVDTFLLARKTEAIASAAL
jgi:SAM-dependent methyltransferase